MLVIDGNSVYEIDEECLKRRKVPKECDVYDKIVTQQERQKKINEFKRNETKE